MPLCVHCAMFLMNFDLANAQDVGTQPWRFSSLIASSKTCRICNVLFSGWKSSDRNYFQAAEESLRERKELDATVLYEFPTKPMRTKAIPSLADLLSQDTGHPMELRVTYTSNREPFPPVTVQRRLKVVMAAGKLNTVDKTVFWILKCSSEIR